MMGFEVEANTALAALLIGGVMAFPILCFVLALRERRSDEDYDPIEYPPPEESVVTRIYADFIKGVRK